MRAARDGQAAISQLRSAAQVAAAHGGIGLLWRCQRDRERRGFLAPLRAFFRRHRPNAARTVQFIPSDVHRISNDAAEGDDVTTSPGSATVTYQELTAAVRGDLIMPRDRGMMIRRRRQDNRKLAGSGGPCWRWCGRRSSSPSWTRGWSTSCSRCCSTTFAPAALSDVLLILDVYAVLPGRAAAVRGAGDPTARQDRGCRDVPKPALLCGQPVPQDHAIQGGIAFAVGSSA